jgi:hypothetical protein
MGMEELGLYGNTYSFEALYKWIQDSTHKENTHMEASACMILMGAPGVGKTFSVTRMCEMLGVTIKKIDSCNCHSIKELEDLLTKMTTTHLTDILMGKVSKNLLFIDEFEILVQLDRNMPSVLYQRLMGHHGKMLPYMPVLVTCCNNIEKKLGDMKREWRCIHLKQPTETDIMLMLRNHIKRNTNQQDSYITADVLMTIAERANGNMQQALQMVDYERLVCKQDSTLQSCEYIQTIDTAPNIDVLYHNPSMETARRLFMEDTWMNPLRFHENLHTELEFRKGTKAKKDETYSHILRCMIEWDTMSAQEDTDGCLGDIAIDHLCNAPCHILAHLKKKKAGGDTTLADFTKTLSQMSLQKKMEKQSYQDDFPWNHIGTYNYMLKKQTKKARNFLA